MNLSSERAEILASMPYRERFGRTLDSLNILSSYAQWRAGIAVIKWVSADLIVTFFISYAAGVILSGPFIIMLEDTNDFFSYKSNGIHIYHVIALIFFIIFYPSSVIKSISMILNDLEEICIQEEVFWRYNN